MCLKVLRYHIPRPNGVTQDAKKRGLSGSKMLACSYTFSREPASRSRSNPRARAARPRPPARSQGNEPEFSTSPTLRLRRRGLRKLSATRPSPLTGVRQEDFESSYPGATAMWDSLEDRALHQLRSSPSLPPQEQSLRCNPRCLAFTRQNAGPAPRGPSVPGQGSHRLHQRRGGRKRSPPPRWCPFLFEDEMLSWVPTSRRRHWEFTCRDGLL